MIEVSAPGKLMLSGEWSILEIGVPCIVLAVNKRVHCKIEKSDELEFNAPDIGIEHLKGEFDGEKLNWKRKLSPEEKQRMLLPEKAIELTLRYLNDIGKETQKLTISTKSDISQVVLGDGSTTKIGFGSSAAALVSIVGAILKLHGFDITERENKDRIYKLAAAAHYIGQGKVGSAFDIAASTYGGAVVYRRFDPNWLISEIESGKKLSEIIDSEWKAFSAENIQLPEDFNLCVAWTKKGASTKELVLKIRGFKQRNEEEYWKIINSIKNVTEELIDGIKRNDKEKIFTLIRDNRKYLKDLSDASENKFETEELSELADIADQHGVAGKFSGAGGGDCGIAVCFNLDIANQIKKTWKEAGLHPINVEISRTGLREERF